MLARDRARKARQAKAKLTMAKESAKVASGKRERDSKDTAITVGNGVTWKRIVSRRHKPRARVAKAKVLAVLMQRRPAVLKTLQLDLVYARVETGAMTGGGTIVVKRHSPWTVVRRCP